MIFPEGLQSLEEFQKVSEMLRAHNKEVLLLANMTEFGVTDPIAFSDFSNAGYNIVIYPVSSLRIALRAVDIFLKDLNQNETVKWDKMFTRKEL